MSSAPPEAYVVVQVTPFCAVAVLVKGARKPRPGLAQMFKALRVLVPEGVFPAGREQGQPVFIWGGPRALRSYIRTFLYMIRYPTLCAFGIVLLEGSGQQWEFCHSLHCCASGGCSSLSHTPS